MEKSTEPYRQDHRRVRANRHIRELTSTVNLSHRDFIQPLFVDESIASRTPVANLNEVHSDTIESLVEQIRSDMSNGIHKFLLFPVPKSKKEKDFDFAFVRTAISRIKREFGDTLWLAADLCLCAYTTHGHCGVLSPGGDRVLNSETVGVLTHYAIELAEAGADCIAPSDMMDGRVMAIRGSLDQAGFDHIAIMSYSAKFSSQFYGPFRDACRSTPGRAVSLKDRKSYQVSIFNGDDAVASALRDVSEGSDIVMVKPALPNLDILQALRTKLNHALAVFHVSGEYQSLELLAMQQLVERSKAHVECWTSMKRAGANMIISYASRHARQWIDEIEY